MSLYGLIRQVYLSARGNVRYYRENKQYQDIKILSLSDTIKAVNDGKSLVRLGDGEMAIMTGNSIWFQSHDEQLGKELSEILKTSRPNLLVAIPSAITNLRMYRRKPRAYWKRELLGTRSEWKKRLNKKTTYGDAIVTRARTDLKTKYQRATFEQWRDVFDGRDIVIIEGNKTRTGVGNNLLEKANSIRRIIGPAKDAYSKVDQIKNEFKKQKIKKDVLVLICLGPAAKQLTVDLCDNGYQAIDAGHLGQEYAFYYNGIYRSSELDDSFDNVKDAKYEKQIIAEIK